MYFLAIVSQEDLLRGNIVPSFFLCQSHGGAESRGPWRVYRADTALASCPKVLVRSPVGNDAMIDFLSAYRTRDHIHNSKKYKHYQTKKYHPEGALFWFECNIYGEPIGSAIFIKCIPDKTIHGRDGGLARLKQALSVRPSAAHLLSRLFWAEPHVFSGVKPKLHQHIPVKNNT